MQIDPTFLVSHFTLFGLELQPWMLLVVTGFAVYLGYLRVTKQI
jgi:hypothetical protein